MYKTKFCYNYELSLIIVFGNKYLAIFLSLLLIRKTLKLESRLSPSGVTINLFLDIIRFTISFGKDDN